MRRAKIVSMAAGAVVMALITPAAKAAGIAYTFTGATGANWSDSTVWRPAGGPPLVGDTAAVQIAGGSIGINLTAPATVGGLTLGTPSGAPFTTDIGNGSTTNALILDNAGGVNNSDGNINPS